MYLIPIPAFTDNYIWLLHDGKRALVVDPGDAGPVRRVLEEHALQLESILVTHHHFDHTGGVKELAEAFGAQVYGPATENIPTPATKLKENETARALGIDFQVIDVPGHTSGHIAFYAPEVNGTPLLFCGDTLFSGGCGRLFEGTPAQMLASLDKLATLPSNTVICGAHEYTLSNLRFAVALDPDNKDLTAYQQQCEQLRQQNLPTLPTSLSQELLVNPFLRTRNPVIQEAVRQFDPSAHGTNSVFAAMRQWKNQF